MSTATTAPTASADAAIWEDLIDIFYAPRQVFARRPDGGRWGLVLLFLTLFMGILFYASQAVLGPLIDAEFARVMEGNANMTAEQMAQARQMAGLFGLVGFVVTFPFGVLLTGFVLWGIGKLFDSVATVAVALLIATYAQLPRVLQQALSVAQGLVLDVSSMDRVYGVSLGPARFLDADAVSPILLGLAGRLDIFIIWSTILLAIGLHVLGRVPKAQAYVAAALVWLLGALPLLLGGLVQPG